MYKLRMYIVYKYEKRIPTKIQIYITFALQTLSPNVIYSRQFGAEILGFAAHINTEIYAEYCHKKQFKNF